MRQVLWRHFQETFQAGDRVLDVACGTGIDAIFLAQQGIQVTGIDASPRMIERLDRKVCAVQLGDRIDARVLDFSQLRLLSAGSFDGIISSFAGLNVESDLGQFAADAAYLLRPGGRMILHLLGPSGLWERLGLLARGQWRVASRLGSQPERDFTIGTRLVRHYLFQPDEAYQRYFAGLFLRQRVYSLGCLRPPHTSRRVPPFIVAGLGRVERTLASHRPLVNWGRFFVLELRRKDRADPDEPAG